MSYIELGKRNVGDPLVKEIFDKIDDNFKDHEDRLNQSETTGGTVFIFNGALHLANFDPDKPDVFYFKATSNFSLNELRVQIFSKGTITSGILALDLQKSNDTNEANFNSVLVSDVNFNFETDPDFSEKVGSINPSLGSVNAGQVLRIVVTSKPVLFNDKILLAIGGE